MEQLTNAQRELARLEDGFATVVALSTIYRDEVACAFIARLEELAKGDPSLAGVVRELVDYIRRERSDD